MVQIKKSKAYLAFVIIFFIFSLVFTSIGVVPYAIYLENKDLNLSVANRFSPSEFFNVG